MISIREPIHPEAALEGARKAHRVVFEDVTSEKGQHGHGPRRAHLEGVLRFADMTGKEPLLVHCWAGVSRSTAVMLALLVRGLWAQGEFGPRLVKRCTDALLAMRPQAIPNPLVLRLALETTLPQPLATALVQQLMQEPRILANRHSGRLTAEEDEPRAVRGEKEL